MSSKPWYHKGLKFGCTQCGNCCRNHGEYSFVYLTPPEVTAIAGWLGVSRKEFLARYCQTDMQLEENILSRDEYQQALRGKRHFRDAPR